MTRIFSTSITGEEFFQHEFPHERSDLSHWRKRLGDKLELLLAQSLGRACQRCVTDQGDLKRALALPLPMHSTSGA